VRSGLAGTFCNHSSGARILFVQRRPQFRQGRTQLVGVFRFNGLGPPVADAVSRLTDGMARENDTILTTVRYSMFCRYSSLGVPKGRVRRLAT